jgi:hypothetical protein
MEGCHQSKRELAHNAPQFFERGSYAELWKRTPDEAFTQRGMQIWKIEARLPILLDKLKEMRSQRKKAVIVDPLIAVCVIVIITQGVFTSAKSPHWSGQNEETFLCYI